MKDHPMNACDAYKILHGFAVSVILVLGPMTHASADPKASLKDRPNVILIMIDNVGYPEIGVNGNDLVKTPYLDRFATEGVRFSRFYSNPLCAPTRASLMTGRYYYRTGVIHTSRGAAKMHGDEVTIAELLKGVGYTTGIFGKWHLGDNYPMRPQDQGFDETLVHKAGRLGQVPDKPNTYIDPKLWENGRYTQKQGYCTDIFFDAAIEFVHQHRRGPFFVYLPTNVAHATSEAGLEAPAQYTAPYLAKGCDKRIATVCGMLDNFDENFGRLIETLTSLGLRDKTLVIFLSDDGHVRINKEGNYRGHGYATPYEGSLRVPCFVQWPGRLQGGLEVNRIASHIDLLPTILEAVKATLPVDASIDGVSLLPLLEARSANWPERMLFLQCERGMTPHRYKNCAVVTERFKLIGYPETFEDRDLVPPRENPVLALYDMASDPGETTEPAICNSVRNRHARLGYCWATVALRSAS